MKMKTITFLILLVASIASTACSDWTDTEAVENNVIKPWEQGPELWAQYTQMLRDYKQREHFLVIAHFDNAPKVATGEKDFMRGLPDSLDMVILTNADNFSRYDAEDMATMREKGTKVLYRVDYAARMEELADAAKLGAYLDKVIASVRENGMDGYSFTGIPYQGDAVRAEAAALLVQKLSADEQKTLIFEGDPTFVAKADRAKVDYFVLNTENTENVTDVKMQVARALGYLTIPASKLLLAADVAAPIMDEEKVEQNAVTELTARVVSLGPLCGLAVHNVKKNYYSAERNYPLVCEAIQTLNPSK
ncbi:MAG: hypothetical protein BHV68_23115 [Bacteroidales bacterium 43_8]|nr:MAG: hypothetical protein BHV68_23115 [Bacteroidales bacterium 43_8]